MAGKKRLHSSLHSSPQEFLNSALKLSLKSSKPYFKTLIHSIKPSSDLSSSLPLSLSNSISTSVQSFQNLLQPNPRNLRSPSNSPLTKTLRRSSRRSKTGSEAETQHRVPNQENEKLKLLERLQILAHIASLCLSHPRKAFSHESLLPGVQLLHDNLILFESESVLSSSVECLCEEWWKENLPGRESLISQTLPFLLSRSLTLKKKVDVHRVYMLREAFSLFDFDDESIEDLKLLLVRCVISPLYLKTEDGRKFLSFLFGLSDQLGKELLAMIRSQIPFGRKSMLEAYGDVLFRAWKAAEGDCRREIENGFLQDMIEAAIHASSGAFASYIRRIIGAFVNQRTTDGVEKLLYRLSEPVIFRSLQVANSNVRQNALHLFLDIFPLEDPDATKEEKDTLLDKQFFLLEKLLMDDCPEVRTISVEGSCRVLHLFWEIIPSPTITKIIKKIFDHMSHDVCSEVRLSVLNGIIYLLGNPHCHEILKVLLPRLRHLMLDNVLTVRVAAADLLINVKDIRNFQFNKVVELDVLLSVLATDQPPVAQRITKLLIPSYFPSKVPIKEACNRCISLVKRSPAAGAKFCKFVILEGASKTHLMELAKVFMSLVLSPDKLDTNQIEGFLVAASYLCDNLASEVCYRNAFKELFTEEKLKGLVTVVSTGQAQSSLFNIVSAVCPDGVDDILEQCMDVVTNSIGFAEDVDNQSKTRSAHKMLLSLGCFDDMFEALTALLHKAAYRCHIKFGTDMPSHSFSSAKTKKSKSSGKFSTKSKVINRKQSFKDDYLVAVGIAWQVRELLLHEDTRKAILRSQVLEMSFFSLKMISEVSIVHCGQEEYMDIYPVLAYMTLALQMANDNDSTIGMQNRDKKRNKNKIESSTSLSETVLELTIEHVLNCLEKLYGANDVKKNGKVDSDNLPSSSRTVQNSAKRCRLSPTIESHPSTIGSVYNEPRQVSCKVKMLAAVLKFTADTTAVSFAPHNHGLFLNYTSKCVQHIISSLDRLYHGQIQFKEEDLKNTFYCVKSSFTYATKMLNMILSDSSESSTSPPEPFALVNDLLDLMILVESYMGSGYASRLLSAAEPWLPDLALALGSASILKRSDSGREHSIVSDQLKLHFPKWPLIVAKTELSKVNEAEEDNGSSQQEKFSEFNRLFAMLIILLKKNPSIMDAVGDIFLASSLVGLERKDFGLALGLLHFVCFKFKLDNKDWGDMMLSSLQEIYPKIKREITEESHEDELEKLTSAKELIEPLWMYHLYETGRVSMTDD
ncbi:putative condensin-2 complex subunit G2 [Lupinus albus]|uniref:Putative condensin-2 complex subunit G2 n=1 Tax=Lupinus albus TaxID=3870 RepID=A0A6A4PZY1_LUPAL|nr:putative condensin-2 complex subunit G2 [Lupinus albus]